MVLGAANGFLLELDGSDLGVPFIFSLPFSVIVPHYTVLTRVLERKRKADILRLAKGNSGCKIKKAKKNPFSCCNA